MTINEAYVVYFSPTHTSKQIAEAIVRGTNIKNVVSINITQQAADEIIIPASALTVVAVPVYAGHVAPLAMSRLQSVKSDGSPAVLAVVYGNRAYEHALTDLDGWACQQGFKTIAGATFIGEHSYSSERHPIASGRPDKDDLAFAADFGARIREKITQAGTPETLYGVDVRTIQRPKQPFFPLFRFLRKVMKLRKSGKPLPAAPVATDADACTHCGACAKACPTGAITLGDELHTDASKCIKCCACVKTCPQHIRVYDTPFAPMLADCFQKQKQPQTIL